MSLGNKKKQYKHIFEEGSDELTVFMQTTFSNLNL
jgi:hypothetical protein